MRVTITVDDHAPIHIENGPDGSGDHDRGPTREEIDAVTASIIGAYGEAGGHDNHDEAFAASKDAGWAAVQQSMGRDAGQDGPAPQE